MQEPSKGTPAIVSCRYLQPHGPGGSMKTSWTLVTFLPKKALLASGTRLTISSLQGHKWAEVRPVPGSAPALPEGPQPRILTAGPGCPMGPWGPVGPGGPCGEKTDTAASRITAEAEGGGRPARPGAVCTGPSGQSPRPASHLQALELAMLLAEPQACCHE